MKKILIIEDDAALLQLLSEVLQVFTKQIFIARDWKQAEHYLQKIRFDVVVTDRLLGKQDAVELVKEIRALTPPTRVLIISGLGSVREKLAGFSAGADDYLPKPFSLRELIFRVKRLLYSEKIEPEKTERLGPVVFYRERRECVFPDGKKVILHKRESDLLQCFLRFRGRLLSREKITELVWPHLVGIDRATVDVNIRRLRKRLGQYGHLIINRRGSGFGVGL